MICTSCQSEETTCTEIIQTVDGIATIWCCIDCGEETESVPPERVDVERDLEITKEGA